MSERLAANPASTPHAQAVNGGGDKPAEPGSVAWLLERQCRLAPAEGGVILRRGAAGDPEIIAIHPRLPDGGTAPAWVLTAVRAVEKIREAGTSGSAGSWFVLPLESRPATPGVSPMFVAAQVLPLASGEEGAALFGAFLLRGQRGEVAVATERLSAGWAQAELRELRAALTRESLRTRQAGLVLEVAGAVGEQVTFKGACTALCDQLASHMQCERVTLGLGTGFRHTGRSIRLRAMSHTEKLISGTQAVQDIELAMEECLDQDAEVAAPSLSGSDSAWVNRAASDLAARNDGRAVLSVPLRTRAGAEDEPLVHMPGVSDEGRGAAAHRVRGVLTLERSGDKPFAAGEVEALRVLLDLIGPQIVHLAAQDRWFGARAASSVRAGLAMVLGPRHVWIKVLAIVLLAAAAFLALAKGTYKVEATFRLEAIGRRVVPAPFDGFLRQADFRPGDKVVAGETVLARLDDTELRLQEAQARAELATHQKELAVAQQEGKTAEEQIARAEAAKVQARIDLLQYQISQAVIYAPVTGIIVEGDLERMRGSPVKTGQVLFELAPADTLRAELVVNEDQIGDVLVGQRGELAAAALPSERFGFTIERIDPVAEVVEQRNVFRVRAALTEKAAWMRPGMEGVAKVDVDRRHYAWIWSRRLINWVRMKLWV